MFQLCGRKFFIVIVLLSSFAAIISFKIITDATPPLDSPENKKVCTFKDYFRRFIWFSDLDRSDKSSKNSIEKFSAAKLENIKALTLSSPEHNTDYSISKNSTSGGAGGGCKIPPGGFKSWTKGTVTKMKSVIRANCTRLFEGDDLEVAQVQLASYSWPVKEHTLNFAKWVKTHSCTHFKDELGDNIYTIKD